MDAIHGLCMEGLVHQNLIYLFIICFTAYIQQDTYSINISSP